MINKLIVGVLCVTGFLIPLTFAAVFLLCGSVHDQIKASIDPGLSPGFEPVGELTIIYIKGG